MHCILLPDKAGPVLTAKQVYAGMEATAASLCETYSDAAYYKCASGRLHTLSVGWSAPVRRHVPGRCCEVAWASSLCESPIITLEISGP